ECLLVPLEVLDKKAPSWSTEGPLLAGSVFEEALADPRSRLLSVVARDGQRVGSASKDVQPLVVDHEVNQTGVIPVTNPVIDAPFAGDRLEVCPSSMPGENAVALDMSVGRCRVTARKTTLGLDWGDLELPITDETLISASTVAVPGKTLVLGLLGGPEPEVA